jgi:hypothetical protein
MQSETKPHGSDGLSARQNSVRKTASISSPLKRENLWLGVGFLLLLGVTALQLHNQGRVWWCYCRSFLWTSDAWGSLTSQTFLDPYSLTHVLHGLMFCGLLTLLVRGMPVRWQIFTAIAMESAWELIENTNTVIQRYREATAALGYNGDTVVNSLGDIMCCGIGFMIGRRLGWRRSIMVFVATELVLLIWIRDSLLLEILTLIHPINAIKVWQLGH